jgi:hypothetical protein
MSFLDYGMVSAVYCATNLLPMLRCIKQRNIQRSFEWIIRHANIGPRPVSSGRIERRERHERDTRNHESRDTDGSDIGLVIIRRDLVTV